MSLFDAYRNRDVFVTGHTGFKGAWLSLWLSELGARVHGYSLEPPTKPNLFDDAGVRERLASHHVGDVRDHESLLKAVRSAKPEMVFHLAAQALVRKSYHHPRETYETNVMGTVNVLESIRGVEGVRVCEIVTSDKCYDNREWVYPYRECEPMGGSDPYSNSKGCAELVVSAYRRSFFPPENIKSHGVSLSSARAGNVIGGGDWAEDRIIPDCIRALSKNESIPVRNPNAIRPWQHVLEPISGYLHLAAMQLSRPIEFADAWNFGPTTTGHLTVREVVEEVIRCWGGGKWNTVAPSAPDAASSGTGSFHEATFLKLDIAKAVSCLHWQPVYGASEAMAETVKWYREQFQQSNRFSAQKMCLEQINAYTNLAAQRRIAWADGSVS
jgi:CDP-glucose 4,6-dehydratase